MDIKKVSINGKIYSPDSATIGAVDQGLMYGVNAFESLRVHAGSAFLLDEHFDRLKKSLQALEIKWDDDRQKYYSWISSVCEDMPDEADAFIRFVVLAGSKAFWVSSEKYDQPQVIIYRGDIPYFSPVAKKAATIRDTRRTLPEYFDKTGFRIKSMDYISARMAKVELNRKGQNLDGILLSKEGFVAEGLTSNIFWSKNGELFTPPLGLGILAGTMRSYLVHAQKAKEALITIKDLESADEILFSSGSSYVNPLSEINGIQKPGTAGKIFEKIYQRLTEDIKNNSKPLG